ncbi:(Fe-S)-binding protein [Candidatus Marimicrobium litorale]|uniref:(Fe-S)-binding protein n=1 Tax=Candidatus Marimicrobium litorale TaxID=2518991 RepID=A0ABT3T5Z2_9GAMM|nr:(Fe-S)-binding protein [Candidatus Marimicrobium litorale]MCX2976889.1 (Fe-S)-binding protein [Candidatus Marimicrobium litorale]
MSKQQQKQVPPTPNRRVTLFVTCLADLFRPSVAFACLNLLEEAGCEVVVPADQTCCGQPAYNSGDRGAAIPLAQQVVSLLEPADYVVIPSGSCAGMITHHYPSLLTGKWRERALEVSAKTYELTVFLQDIAGIPPRSHTTTAQASVTYHDGCAGLRELGIQNQPRQLLKNLCGVDVDELQQSEVCCGFGGTFCAKMPEISARMVDDKLENALATGATVLTGGDLGCLMNIAGRARRQGKELEVRHIAELLADQRDTPAIGEGQ